MQAVRPLQLVIAAGLIALVGLPESAVAQIAVPPKSAPHDGYWACFDSFYEGDFRSAAAGFREAAKDGIVNMDLFVGGPWIDSICFHAMLGECY